MAERLQSKGLSCQLITLQTEGDLEQKTPLSQVGTPGIFTKTLEKALLQKQIDLAVHSAKDLPTQRPQSLNLIAFTQRADPRDVVLSHRPLSLESHIRIATSSLRRQCLLSHLYPQVKVLDIRGNLTTRIEKMKKGYCDALILAAAGVHRLGYQRMIRTYLSSNTFPPAAGQGSLAIEVRKDMPEEVKTLIGETLNHHDTSLCVQAERAFLQTLGVGCREAVCAFAELKTNDTLSMRGGLLYAPPEKNIIAELNAEKKENFFSLGVGLGKKIAHLRERRPDE